MLENDGDTLHLAVRNDIPILMSIIDKARAVISDEERFAISEKWLQQVTNSGTHFVVELTTEKRQWFIENNTIYVGSDPEQAPLISIVQMKREVRH